MDWSCKRRVENAFTCVLVVILVASAKSEGSYDRGYKYDASTPEPDSFQRNPPAPPQANQEHGEAAMNRLMADGGAEPNMFPLPEMSPNETVPDQWGFNPFTNFSTDHIETNRSRELDTLQPSGLQGLWSMFSGGGSNLVNKLSNNVTSGAFGRAAMRSSGGGGSPSDGDKLPVGLPAATFAATLPETPGFSASPKSGQSGAGAPSIAMAMGVPKELLSSSGGSGGMNRISQIISKPQASPFSFFKRNLAN